MNIINTRADLDSITGTPEHEAFIRKLAGSMTYRQDTQTYPENYGQPDYTGEQLEPVWQDVEDLSTIERFGYTRQEIEALIAGFDAA